MTKLLYVKFVCVSVSVKLWYVSIGGRRREAEEPGTQNQKQEPHTKLWGRTTTQSKIESPTKTTQQEESPKKTRKKQTNKTQFSVLLGYQVYHIAQVFFNLEPNMTQV